MLRFVFWIVVAPIGAAAISLWLANEMETNQVLLWLLPALFFALLNAIGAAWSSRGGTLLRVSLAVAAGVFTLVAWVVILALGIASCDGCMS